jgi:hypothetical protein
MVMLLGGLRKAIWRWHGDLEQRSAIHWPALWGFSFHDLIWLFIWAMVCALAFLIVDVTAAIMHVWSSDRPGSFTDIVSLLNVISYVVYLVIFVVFGVSYNESQWRFFDDPLLRSVPLLGKYNSSVVIYVILVGCCLPVLIERMLWGYIVVSQAYNISLAVVVMGASIYSVVVVRKSRNFGSFSVDPLLINGGIGLFLLFFLGGFVAMVGFIAVFASMMLHSWLPEVLQQLYLTRFNEGSFGAAVGAVSSYLDILWKTLVAAALIVVFSRCAYLCFLLVAHPPVNFEGLVQIDHTLSLIFTCNATIMFALLRTFGGEYCLWFLVIAVVINLSPVVMSDSLIRRVALPPREFESRSWRRR